MDKKDLLALMRLLSALESWSFTAGQRLPDYLHDDLDPLLNGDLGGGRGLRRCYPHRGNGVAASTT